MLFQIATFEDLAALLGALDHGVLTLLDMALHKLDFIKPNLHERNLIKYFIAMFCKKICQFLEKASSKYSIHTNL